MVNYRPITICNNTSKIFEKVLYDQILNHLIKHKLLSPNQYGFCKSRSTLFAMTHLQAEICAAKSHGFYCATVFIDLSKAFDVINHKILCYKLKEQFGFSESAVNLIMSYLTNRRQKVVINNVFSHECLVNHGVPQGSVLGPLLFIIYFNDIIKLVSNDDSMVLYADDCTLVFKCRDKNMLENKIQNKLLLLQKYFKANSLFLNISKTKIMYFNKSEISLNICLDNIQIKIVKKFKFLGFHLDDKLNWSDQADFIVRKLNSICCLIHRIKHFLPKKIILLVFNSLALPHIYYAIVNFASQYKTMFQKIVKKFNQCGTVLHDCTASHLVLYDWPDLNDKIGSFKMSFLHKLFNSPYDEPLLKYIRKKSVNNYLTRQNVLCDIFLLRSKQVEQSFEFWAPRLINKHVNEYTKYSYFS